MTVTDDERAQHRERIAEAGARTGATPVPYPIRIREVEVSAVRPLGSGLLRISLGGPGAAGFESHVPTEHVKLLFADERGELPLPEPDGLRLRWPRPLPVSREYTVRHHDPETGRIDIDVALHPGGLASEWARRAVSGARIHVAGPPGGLVVPDTYDRYLLAGDITALPAIARWLEALPRTAAGWAFVEVADAAQEIPIDAPDGVEMRWLHSVRGERLATAVPQVAVPEGASVYAWLAAEAGALRPLRRWVRDELRLAPEHHCVTGYWKRGVADFDEDEH